MTSERWTMRDYRDWSPSRRTLYSDPRRRRYRVDADDDRKIRSAYEDCEALSPNRSLRKIAELESRIAELTSSSESMMKRLGRAERTLRDINLDDNSDDSSAAITSRRRAIDAILSDDEDVARRRRHIHTQPEELRDEIARLREDVRVLKRRSMSCDFMDRSTDYCHYDDYDDDDDDELTDWGRRQLNESRAPASQIDSRRLRSSCDGRGYRTLSPTRCNSSGQRSIFGRPLTTQHNKHGIRSPTAGQRKFFHTFDVSAKRAYRPHVPGDLNIGDVVRFRRLGGNIQVGQVRYIGHLPGKSEPFVGVETEYATGNHDGSHEGFQYFECKPNRGLFVPFDHVIMAWGSY